MPSYGQRPDDVVQDTKGNALQGVTISFYDSESAAEAGGTSLGTAITDNRGRWRYAAADGELWARLPDATVWQVASERLGTKAELDAETAARQAADALLLPSADAAATYETKSNVTSGLAGKVDKGSLVYYAGDYASLSAALTAVPSGATLLLAPNTTYTAAGLTSLTKTVTIVGHGSRSSIIDAGANAYGFTLPGAGTLARLTFRGVGFIGSTSAQIRLWRDRHASAKFVECRFSGFTQIAVETSGTDVEFIGCEFDGEGTPGSKNAVYHQYGAQLVAFRGCDFRYLNRGLYCTDVNGPAASVIVDGCTFDGAWFMHKATASGSGGTVTYAATTVTDTGASFGALTVGSTVRALAVKQTGTITAIARSRITDTAANFTTAAVKRGDFLRVSGKFGIVDEVVSATVVKIEKWIDATTYADVEPPAVTTAYTVYGLVIGKVASNTATVITVDRWRDWDGTIATPAAGTLYEVAPKGDYQCYIYRAEHAVITGNVFRRSWSDQIAPFSVKNLVVSNNVVTDGQDVGITVHGTSTSGGAVVVGNRINHQGTAGIWTEQPGALIESNVIIEPNWMSGPSDTYAGIMLETGCSGAKVANNVIRRVNHPNALKAIHLNGTSDGVFLDGNVSTGYTTDLVITGTGVTNVSGRFQPNTVVSLVSSAVGPRGEFSGSGVPAVPASAGSTFRRTDGGASTSFYVKETASSSTVWVAK